MADPTDNVSRKTAAPQGRFDAYASDLYRFLLRMIQRPHDAEDLRQEVFARLTRIPDRQLARDPKAYLFGVAFHVLREFRMRERRERVAFDSDAVEEAAAQPNELHPDEMADRLSLQQQLERALSELGPKERAVLLLVKRDGMSYEEAAAAAGVSIHQVERFVTAARSKLKLLLRERQ